MGMILVVTDLLIINSHILEKNTNIGVNTLSQNTTIEMGKPIDNTELLKYTTNYTSKLSVVIKGKYFYLNQYVFICEKKYKCFTSKEKYNKHTIGDVIEINPLESDMELKYSHTNVITSYFTLTNELTKTNIVIEPKEFNYWTVIITLICIIVLIGVIRFRGLKLTEKVSNAKRSMKIERF
jgi:hypothetical protein